MFPINNLTMQQDYFGIELSGDICLALPLESLVKVTQLKQKNLCFIPGMAPFWLGVMNYQGSLVWVLDTNHFLNLIPEKNPYRKTLTAVIVKHKIDKKQRRVALIANKIQGILNSNNFQSLGVNSPLPSQYQSLIQETILGNRGAIDILDLKKFFQLIKTATSLKALA